MGFWNALDKIFPSTKHQRCWVHKVKNVLNHFPKPMAALKREKPVAKSHRRNQVQRRRRSNRCQRKPRRLNEARHPKSTIAHPAVAEVVPLSDVRRAHERVEAGEVQGKLVMRVTAA